MLAEDISKSNDKKTVPSPLRFQQILDKCRQQLEEQSDNDAKFYGTLAETMNNIEVTETEADWDGKKHARGIKPKEWSEVVSVLDTKLAACVDEASRHSFETAPDCLAKIEAILAFAERYFQATRHRTHPAFVNSVVHLLKFDDLDLVVKALRIMRDYGDRKEKRTSAGTFGEKETAQWLLNTALGRNLKNNGKMGFLEMLREPAKDLVFQYFSLGSRPADSSPHSPRKVEGGVPSIRTIKLSHLSGNKSPSYVLAEDLAKQSNLPKNLFPALWCKVRTAKTDSRYQLVLASLLAYNVFLREISEEEEIKNFIAETELKTRLVTDLTQLLKFSSAKTELHVAAIEILTALTEKNSSFMKAMGDAGTELSDEMLRQLGVNVTHNGLLHNILRETTSLQVAKDSRSDIYRVRVPSAVSEILAPATASDPKFLACLLRLLRSIYRNSDREDLSSQEAGRFWTGVRTALMNMLQPPYDDRCYVYRVPLTTSATQLLLSAKQSAAQDVANVDAVISRFAFEIQHLEAKEGALVYPVAEQGPMAFPGLEQRQELCKSLAKLLSSSINLNAPRNVELAEEENEENEFARGLRHRGRHNIEEIYAILAHRPRNEEQARERARIAALGGADRDEEEEEKDNDGLPHGEAVAVSRRVLESKLIELFSGMFRTLAAGARERTCVAYEPIVYSALTLVSSVIRDIPTSIPGMLQRGAIPAILQYLSRTIAPGPNYFSVVLATLNAFTLQEEGAMQVASYKNIIELLFKTLIIKDYDKFFRNQSMPREGMDEAARQLLTLYSQAAPSIKTEIPLSIRKLLSVLRAIGYESIKKLGSALEAGKKGEKEARKQCKCYCKAIHNVLGLMSNLVESVGSREHTKLLASINENNEVLKDILTISRLEAVLKGEGLRKHNDSSFSHVIEYYIGSIGRLESRTGSPPEQTILEAVMSAMDSIKTLFSLSDSKISLGDFVTNKRSLRPTPACEILTAFPKEQKLLVALNTVCWICKSAKLLCNTFPRGCETVITFVAQFQVLLLRELLRLYSLTTDKDSERRKGALENVVKYLNSSEEEAASKELTDLLSGDIKSGYEKTVCRLYTKIRTALPGLMQLKIHKRTSMYDMESRAVQPEVMKCIGKCAARFLNEAVADSSAKLMGLTKENVAECEMRVMHNLLLVKDVFKIMINDSLSIIQVYEFYKAAGFDLLQGIYQNTVNMIIDIQSQPNSLIKEELKLLATYIVKIYTTIMDPRYLRKLSSRLVQITPATELVAQGFKTSEDFVASVLAYVFESILFQTKYGEYKTAVRFLSECVQPAFAILLDVIKKYPNKNTISQLLQEGGPESSYEEYVDRRRRRERAQQPVPPDMIEQLLLMGFDSTEAEEALRRSDLNLDMAITDMITRRDEAKKFQEQVFTSPASLGARTGMRKLEAKMIHKEFEGWLDYILASLYEALYSISSYQCKYLLYSLIEFQSLTRPYKVRHAFALLLNELQTLLFSLELTYEFVPIPNDEFPVTELAEANITEKFRRRIDKYTKAEGGIKEQELIVLHKMGTLIDVITTFLRLSKTNELLKVMCENKIAQCLIVVLSKLVQKELILPGRKLIPKVLLLLAMIYKEVHQTFQAELLEQRMKSLMTGAEDKLNLRAMNLLPGVEDTKKLVQLLCQLLDMDPSISATLSGMKSGKKVVVLVTTEIMTAVALLLTHLTKDYANVEVVVKSGIMQKLLALRQAEGCRSAIPSGLFTELVFNLFESPELQQKYMERVISTVLFAKTQWREKGGKIPASEEEVESLQRASAFDMDRFLGHIGFLMARNAYVFFQSCQEVSVLQKEIQKDSKDKVVAKYTIALNKECLMRMINEGVVNIPNVKVQDKKQATMTKEEHEYNTILNQGIKDSLEIMKTTNADVLLQILTRLIEVHFEAEKELFSQLTSTSKYVVTENLLLEIIGQLIRVYPEVLALLLTFNTTGAKVSGNSLVSFLLSSLFPLRYISPDMKLQSNDEWKSRAISLVKYMTYSNARLHLLRHTILISEIRKRVVAETFRVLNTEVRNRLPGKTEVPADPLALACAYSIFSLLEGLLISNENTVQFPRENQYSLLREIVASPQSIVKMCTMILRRCSLHSKQSELVTTTVVNVLERIIRFNKTIKKIEPVKHVETTTSESRDIKCDLDLYMEKYVPLWGEPMEVAEDEDEKAAEIAEEIEYVGEEEVKIPSQENDRAGFSPRRDLEHSPNESEEDEGEPDDARRSPEDIMRHLMSDGSEVVEPRRIRQRARRPRRNVELDAVQVQINAEPVDKGKSKDVKNGLSDIYEREAAGDTNNQIIKLIKGDVLGEERQNVNEPKERDDLDYMRYRVDPWRIREEEEKQEELPAISLFGYVMDKTKISELLKNQLIGTLQTQIVNIEEPKKEVKKEKPAVAPPEVELKSTLVLEEQKKEPRPEEKKAEETKQPESKAEEAKRPESKAEEAKQPESKTEEAKRPASKEEEKKTVEPHKEEKKVETAPPPVPTMSPAELANYISSMMANPPAPSEEAKHEQKSEESKQVEAGLTQVLVAQRRQELARLVPNMQIDDSNVLLQIDIDFLRALTPELRVQSVQQLLAQNRPPASSGHSPARGPAEMDPATFIATITDENLRDEILMSATPEFLAVLPPDMAARAEHLRERSFYDRVLPRHGRGEESIDEGQRGKPKRTGPADPLETLVLVPDKGDEAENDIAQAIFRQSNRISEPSFESLIRLLYVNTKCKVPLNSLFSSLCTSKKYLYKLLNSLLFILSKHNDYEKYFQSKLMSTSLSDCISEAKLTDTYFPPICLYRGMEFNHLTYSIISLRIFSLLSSLLNKPSVTKYFFMPSAEVSAGLESITSLKRQLGSASTPKGSTPLTELLALSGNPVYKNSERHLESLINFINDLFNTSDFLVKQKKEGDQVCLPVISVENVRQMCQIFYFEVTSDASCAQLSEILLKLSQIEENALAIISEIDHVLDLIGTAAAKEWTQEVAMLEPTMSVGEIREKEEKQEDTCTEVKLGRILRLLKRLYDGYCTKAEDDTPNKLIRLYVSEGDSIEETLPLQKKESVPQTEAEGRAYRIRKSIMAMLKKPALTEAFNALTDLLSIISKKSLGENSSRKSQLLLRLVPSIESLIMAYDYHFRDPADAMELLGQVKQIREAKPEAKESLGLKYRRAYVFYKFLDRNHKAFNNLIRQMSQQTFQTVIKPFIIRFPSLLDFENKRNYFRHEQTRIRGRAGMASLRIAVSRNTIFTDSYNQMAALPVEDLKGRMRVSFNNEQAADAGGVTREWYTTLSRAMFNPIIGLFKKSAHGNTYQPDPKSVIEPNHLNYFKFIGRIIGKALLDGQYLECYFTRALYKTLVGQTLTIQDMQDYDAELYKSLLWMRDNDVNELDCNFTYSTDYFGQLVTKELMENGKNVKVTNDNKQLFIVKMCKAMLYDEIKPQIEALQKGLYEVIPKQLVSIFDYREIELLISGLPDVDLMDLKKNTEYHGYTESSKVIVWLWEVMETFSTKERAEFLQFVTGTSKVPLDGFKSLPGASGIQPFQIHKVYGDVERLPTTHTWQGTKITMMVVSTSQTCPSTRLRRYCRSGCLKPFKKVLSSLAFSN